MTLFGNQYITSWLHNGCITYECTNFCKGSLDSVYGSKAWLFIKGTAVRYRWDPVLQVGICTLWICFCAISTIIISGTYIHNTALFRSA